MSVIVLLQLASPSLLFYHLLLLLAHVPGLVPSRIDPGSVNSRQLELSNARSAQPSPATAEPYINQ